MGLLTLRYRPEDEWHGEVVATVDSDGFAGAASAWFNNTDLGLFADRMSEYPLKTPPLSLAGGYFSQGGELERHVDVTILPHDPLGNIRVVVELTSPDRGYDELGTYCRVRTWFTVAYPDLERFQRGLRRMVKGEAEQAELTRAL